MPSFFDHLPARLTQDPLRSMWHDSDIEAIAESIIAVSQIDPKENHPLFETAARHLLAACLGYLRDWCRPDQRTFGNLDALLESALMPVPGLSETKLDNLFFEIESGCRRVPAKNGLSIDWLPSPLQRRDGLYPRDSNGICPEEDYSLGHYHQFAQSTAPGSRAVIVPALIAALSAGNDGD